MLRVRWGGSKDLVCGLVDGGGGGRMIRIVLELLFGKHWGQGGGEDVVFLLRRFFFLVLWKWDPSTWDEGGMPGWKRIH